MAFISMPFDSYQLYYYGGPNPSPAAVIIVYGAGAVAGQMSFYGPGPIPLNGTFAPLGQPLPSLNFPLAGFNDLVQVLRYTKALMISVDTTSNWGEVATTAQVPTGEEEAK